MHSWEPVHSWEPARQFTKSDQTLNHTHHGALSACAFLATDVSFLQCTCAFLLLTKAYDCVAVGRIEFSHLGISRCNAVTKVNLLCYYGE